MFWVTTQEKPTAVLCIPIPVLDIKIKQGKSVHDFVLYGGKYKNNHITENVSSRALH